MSCAQLELCHDCKVGELVAVWDGEDAGIMAPRSHHGQLDDE